MLQIHAIELRSLLVSHSVGVVVASGHNAAIDPAIICIPTLPTAFSGTEGHFPALDNTQGLTRRDLPQGIASKSCPIHPKERVVAMM